MKFTRTCIACRKKDNKYNLLRIVSLNGNAILDKDGKANSRGIYICRDKECIKKLLKMKNINKVIKNDIKSESLKMLLCEMEDM